MEQSLKLEEKDDRAALLLLQSAREAQEPASFQRGEVPSCDCLDVTEAAENSGRGSGPESPESPLNPGFFPRKVGIFSAST